VPRPALFTREELLRSAVALAAEGGPEAVTMQGLAEAVGAPNGSVYHRFSGRPELLAEVWVSVVERFQRDWWAAAEGSTDAGELAAWTVRWAREHRDLARTLALHRAEEFLRAGAPPALRRRVRACRADVARGLAVMARRFLGESSPEALERTSFALAAVPLAALRGRLAAAEPIGPGLEACAREAATALLARR